MSPYYSSGFGGSMIILLRSGARLPPCYTLKKTQPFSLWLGTLEDPSFGKTLPNSRFIFSSSPIVFYEMARVLNLFWYANWQGTPLAFFGKDQHKPPNRFISFFSLTRHWQIVLPQPVDRSTFLSIQRALTVALSRGTDALTWKLAPDGNFSVASTYKAISMMGEDSVSTRFHLELQAPPLPEVVPFLLSSGQIANTATATSTENSSAAWMQALRK